MKKERQAGLWLRKTEHSHGHLWHRYIVTAKKIMMATEEFEDTKGVIRIPKSKKNRQHNGQKKKDKQRSTKHYT
jgi:peptidyl-tRNA hydrolase